MSIDKISGITAAPLPVKSKSDTLGQEDFLKILVAQMNNQDPTNPADNAEFLGQMAQFSMVSGINDLGTSMDGVANTVDASRSLQASALVNREVLVESSTVRLEGGRTLDGIVPSVPGVTAVNVQVRDLAGNLVKTVPVQDIGNQRLAFSWDGSTELGAPAPEGAFTLTASALVGTEQIRLPVYSFARVKSVEVDPETQSVSLALNNDETKLLSTISQYR
jgi:flagellar basal-body rod modification protein FlgD